MFRIKLKAFKLVNTLEREGARNWRGKEEEKSPVVSKERNFLII